MAQSPAKFAVFTANTSSASSPAPSESSAAKLRLSTIAAKLITGVQSASPQVARERWNNNHDPNVPRPSSHCRPKPAARKPDMPPSDPSVRKSVTAAAWQQQKQDRASRHPAPSSAPRHNRSPSVPVRPVSVCAPDRPRPDHNQSPDRRTRLPPLDSPSGLQLGSPTRPRPLDSDRAPFDSLLLHPNLHHIQQHQQPAPRTKSKSSAPPAFSTELDRSTNSAKSAGPPDRATMADAEPKLKPPPSSRFSRFKATATETFVAVAYSTTNPNPNASDSNRASSITESDPEPATFEVAQRARLPSSPVKPKIQDATQRSELAAIRAVYLAQGQVEAAGGERVETEKERVAREFEQLMAAMELTPAVRVKMGGLDHPVKAAMLRASGSSQLASHSMLAQALQLSSTLPGKSSLDPPSMGGSPASERVGEERNGSERDGPAWWAMQLKAHNFRELEPAKLRRLRVALRTQAPAWTAEFVSYGGFVAMMKRLKELLDLEWREEQHDDQVLYEILRCFKALLLSEPGKAALATRMPSPFVQLIGLLYSEKKPGDLACRQLLVELIHGIFELKGFDGSIELDWNSPLNLEASASTGSGDAHELVRRLLLGPPDLKREQIVEFVSQTHRVRPFKKLVTELTGVLMDYFWVFCHAENQFWDIRELDEEKIESPKVPSGMTGGVEYEAMGYCTAMLRLINEMTRTAPSEDQKAKIHSELFESGFERALVTLRKSSMSYYPAVHLELARYLGEAVSVDGVETFKVPMNVMRHLRKSSNLLNC